MLSLTQSINQAGSERSVYVARKWSCVALFVHSEALLNKDETERKPLINYGSSQELLTDERKKKQFLGICDAWFLVIINS